MKFLYRDHRGSLESSMKTVQEMSSADELRTYVRGLMGVDPKAKISLTYVGQDDRNGWNTYYVCANGQCVGMTNKGII